jgi:hypothetical protein
MKTIFWVFGSSAAGKQTFINSVLNNPNSKIVNQFNWHNKIILSSKKSLDLIGKSDNDPITEKREEILEEISQILNQGDIFLIKWQGVDTKATRPERLKEMFPNINHEIIYLQAKADLLKERLPRKDWWREEFNLEDWVAGEPKIVQDEVENLRDNFGFNVLIINSDDMDYQMIKKI